MSSEKTKKQPSLLLSLIPIITLVILLVINVTIFKDDATSGANQMALLISAGVAAFIAVFVLRRPYKDIEKKMLNTIQLSMQANLILLIVGSLIAVWILSGVVPTMIYYGVKIINPNVFLPLSCIVCAIVSLATGSSWSTGGTVGIALLGIGKSLGLPEEMVVASIISGSYFGDKMSPLSDTTNLAPAVAGSELFEHIRHMLYTTIPALMVAIIGYCILSYFYTPTSTDMSGLENLLSTIDNNFHITPWLFLVPVTVIVMVAKKVPAIPALAGGVVVGVIAAVIFQGELIDKMTGEGLNAKDFYKVVMQTMYDGFVINSKSDFVNSLFNRGGMSGMLNTVWLIVVAMVFGGVMEAAGMLQKISSSILKIVRGTTSLVAATISTSVFLNMTASDQYLSIVVTGKIFRGTYEKFGLKAKNFSRTIEDGATVTSVLVPWNSGGAYFSGILGVATLSYLPYCFFNLACPLMAILLAGLGIGQHKLDEADNKKGA